MSSNNNAPTAADLRRAFNVGADSRIAGRPVATCPYGRDDLRRSFEHGWTSADREWGADVHPSRRTRLPEVVA